MIEKKQPTVMITGASSGLGFAFAQEFAKKNYNIVMVSLEQDRLNKATEKISKAATGFIHAIALDLAKPSAGKELFSQIEKENIVIDILINNAGFGTVGAAADADLQEQVDQMTLNAMTPTTLSMLFAKDMAKRGGGKILNIASMAAFAPGPNMAVYYATKSYLFRFSTALSYELRGSGVVISTFCPGPVSTHSASRAHATKTRLFSRQLPSAEEVVKVAIDGLKNNKMVIFGSRKHAAMAFLLRLLPLKTTLKITSRLNH